MLYNGFLLEDGKKKLVFLNINDLYGYLNEQFKQEIYRNQFKYVQHFVREHVDEDISYEGYLKNQDKEEA